MLSTESFSPTTSNNDLESRFSADHRRLLRLLREHGRLSRWELHELTGFRPNLVGRLVAGLLEYGLLREVAATRGQEGPGRPRIPLELDTESRQVIGLYLQSDFCEIARVNILGECIDILQKKVHDPSQLLASAADLLGHASDERALSIGVSIPGFIDPQQKVIVLSSAFPKLRNISLEPLVTQAGEVPVYFHNKMHALASKWLLSQRTAEPEDTLLVSVEDGAIGASLLINGQPNRGCITGACELGHSRFPVETVASYSGRHGNLEQIFNSSFLKLRGAPEGTRLHDIFDGAAASQALADEVLGFLGMALGNVINFCRPHRVVLWSTFCRYTYFKDRLLETVRDGLIGDLSDRIRFELRREPESRSAETAAWLGLHPLFAPTARA